jgi:hypothetical protein
MITKPFTGIPAPDFLPDDPWFGNAIYSKKQQEKMIAELVRENLILNEDNASRELDNIHQIMYNLSTQFKSYIGGSENVWH